MLKKYIVPLVVALSVCACGENKGLQDGAGKAAGQEAVDTASIRHSAKTMAADMQEHCSQGDIETLAALAQEATDNISYALSEGERQFAEIYAAEIQDFLISNAAAVGDMASHNYVIKQLVITVFNMPSAKKGAVQDSIMHMINSPISTKRPGE